MHGFFERYNFKIQTEEGRQEMIAKLNNLHNELFKAWQAATKLSAIMLAVVKLAAENAPRSSSSGDLTLFNTTGTTAKDL